MKPLQTPINYSDLLPGIPTLKVEETLKKLHDVATAATKEIFKEKSIISFSGGIDSSILASLATRVCTDPITLLAVGREESTDIKVARESLSSLDQTLINFTAKSVSEKRIENSARKVAETSETRSLSHFEDCVAFHLIGEEIFSLGLKGTVVSANGADELFCGYDRFRRIIDSEGHDAVESEMKRAVEVANELRLKVSSILSEFQLRTAEPFLNNNFVSFALSVPVEMKILKGDDRLRKRIWRAYGRKLGLNEATVFRQKKAMQFGMGIHPVVLRLLRKGALKLPVRNPSETNQE